MFEIGFSEILVIMAIALVVLGPEKLPRLASQVGRWVGRAKAMARQFREQLEEEANKLDLAKDLKKNFDLSKELNQTVGDTSPPHAPSPPQAAGEPATPTPDSHGLPETIASVEPTSSFHSEPISQPTTSTEASVDSAHERRH
jgi:sec-independent protein translocase protein TatB